MVNGIEYRGPEVGSITAGLARLDKGSPGILSWATVRVFGELQILSRASFGMLIVVPVLAALWPNIQVLVNQYNESLEIMISQLELLNSRLGSTADDAAEQELLDATALNISQTIEPIRDRVASSATLEPRLPLVWGVAFFSSLSAVIAQVIYQTRAPQLVKAYDLRGFVDASFENEMKVGTDRNTDADVLDRFVAACADQYYEQSTQRPVQSAVSLTLYGVALAGIIWILLGQSAAVYDAIFG